MKFSLGFRVFIGFLAINLFYILILIVAIIRLNEIGERASLFTNIYLPLYRYVQRLDSSRYITFEDLKNAIEQKGEGEKAGAIESYYQNFKNNSLELLVRIKNLLNIAENTSGLPKEEDSFNQLRRRVESLEQRTEQYNKAVEKLIESIKLGIYPGPIDYWIPVENAEGTLRKEQRILMMQTEGLMRILIRGIEEEENRIRWQLIIFTVIAFLVSVIVLISIERRLGRITRLSSRLDSMILNQQFEPLKTAEEDEVSDLVNKINNLISEFSRIQRETDYNRDQLLTLTTNLRKLNSELEYIKSFNESIFNSIKVPIFVLNERLELIKCNPASKSTFSIDETAKGKDISFLIPKLNDEEIKKLFHDALFEKKTQLLEEINLGDSNRQLIADIIISPFLGEGGEVRGVILIIEDRTEIIRTRRLLNQSERLATIGRMAAQLTHQIKNPLSTIGLNLELIRDDILEARYNREDHLKRLHIIQEEISNLVRLSDEYLRFARISNPRLEDIDINRLISGIAELYSLECRSKNIKLRLSLSDRTPVVKGDYNQLKQAIINVFVNAIESLKNGGEIKLQTELSDGFVNISVSDNGEGLSEASIKHIFDPFYTTKEGGAGLGLSIAAQIIEQSGGRITCENNPDKGATFRIRLPVT